MKKNRKNILITGGIGYIGSHGVVAFEEAGYKTVIVDNLCNSSIEVLDGIEKILGYKPDFYEVDLRDKAGMEEVFKKYDFDGVLHFAGLKAVGESCKNPIMYFDNNVNGSICLFELMEKYSVKNIIFSSTATVYDTNNSIPYNETQSTGLTSNTYSTTKYLIEKILLDLSKFSGFKVMNLRYFNPIGAHKSGYIGEDPEGLPNNLLPYILKVAKGELSELKVFGGDYDTIDGTGVRDYIDVNDLIEGHLKAYEGITHCLLGTSLEKGRLNTVGGFYENYNLGVGIGVSVLEIIKEIEKVVGKKINYNIVDRRVGDLGEFYCDSSKALKKIGWEVKISLEESLNSSWNFVNK